MKTPPQKLSFGEAVSEVEEILADLEAETVDIDTLGQEVKRAVELIQVCRQKLEKTDSEVRELVAGLEPRPESGKADSHTDSHTDSHADSSVGDDEDVPF